MAKKKEQEQIIELKRIKTVSLAIKVVGDGAIILHAWSAKAIRQIQDKQAGKAKAANKEPREPEREYCESMYWLGKDGEQVPPGDNPESHKYGFGIPSVQFKASAVAACRNIENIPMTLARGAFHIKGNFCKIIGSKPRMRTDMVRIGGGSTSDVRYRGEFEPWSCTLNVVYNKGVMTAEQVVNLFNVAGFACGVGEWRPSSKASGSHGMFHVE